MLLSRECSWSIEEEDARRCRVDSSSGMIWMDRALQRVVGMMWRE